MTEWLYDGYTKIHSNDGRHMIETWIWKCAKCGHEVRKPFGNQNKPKGECQSCSSYQNNDSVDCGMVTNWRLMGEI